MQINSYEIRIVNGNHKIAKGEKKETDLKIK